MAAVLIRPATTDPTPALSTPNTAAVAYQRVLHQAVRREMRLLAELTSWADAEDAGRAGHLTQHAMLVAKLLLQHHATERELLWPAVVHAVPAVQDEHARAAVAEWTHRTALLDHALRDLSTVARQWAVATTEPSRRAFEKATRRLADSIDTHVEQEEAELLPLIGRHLPAETWVKISNRAQGGFDGREQMLVLGMVLEDATAIDRARVLAGLSPAARTAWRVYGRRNYRAAVVRLRGAPPAA
jgi:hypothetical protein